MELNQIFDNMEKKSKTSGVCDLAHDEIVLRTTKLTPAQLNFLLDPEIIVLPKNFRCRWEFEAEVPGAYGPGTCGFADLKLFVDGAARLLFEIKSKPEPQSASSWHRQTRSYFRASRLPCVLVVAHDLQDYMYEYLEAAGTPWFDLRAAK